jgi:hypothetical protein
VAESGPGGESIGRTSPIHTAKTEIIGKRQRCPDASLLRQGLDWMWSWPKSKSYEPEHLSGG